MKTIDNEISELSALLGPTYSNSHEKVQQLEREFISRGFSTDRVFNACKQLVFTISTFEAQKQEYKEFTLRILCCAIAESMIHINHKKYQFIDGSMPIGYNYEKLCDPKLRLRDLEERNGYLMAQEIEGYLFIFQSSLERGLYLEIYSTETPVNEIKQFIVEILRSTCKRVEIK